MATCSTCGGDGIDGSALCLTCYGTGTDQVYTVRQMRDQHVIELMRDIMDKCNDIKEKVDEIKEVVDEL